MKNRFSKKETLTPIRFNSNFLESAIVSPEIILKQTNLSLEVAGGGDTYQKGEFIPFTIFIRNDDSISHYLIPSGLNDPCQLKVIISDEREEKVFDSSDRIACTPWVNLEELPPGEKKEYNYIWQAPKNLVGDLIFKAFLDYSRLDGQEIVSQTKVLIK